MPRARRAPCNRRAITLVNFVRGRCVAAPRLLSDGHAVGLGLTRRRGPAVQLTEMLLLAGRRLVGESSRTPSKYPNHYLEPFAQHFAVYSRFGSLCSAFCCLLAVSRGSKRDNLLAETVI